MSDQKYARKVLLDTEKLGGFSPETFEIGLEMEAKKYLSQFTRESLKILNHEFGHLLQYLSSYLGLMDLGFWIDTINILHRGQFLPTLESHLTWQSEQVVNIARDKQVLSIDDEYYYERNEDEILSMRYGDNRWVVAPRTGSLFRSDGTLSNRRFFCLRFYRRVSESDHRPFVRVPIGMRTLLEHMARASDIIHLHKTEGNSDLNRFYEEAKDPDFVHYYALTHFTLRNLEDHYGTVDEIDGIILTGHIVRLITMIPFDDPLVWQSIQLYSEDFMMNFSEHLEAPHPSFLFPFILDAILRRYSTIEEMKEFGSIESYNILLARLGLPEYSDLQNYVDARRQDLLTQAKLTWIGAKIAELVEWVEHHIKTLDHSEIITNPLKGLSGALPVPVLFPQGIMDGEIISTDDVSYMKTLTSRRNEMLRYHYARNIIT